MKRSPSAGYGFEPNKNTDWLDDRLFFVYYGLLVLGLALLLCQLHLDALTDVDMREETGGHMRLDTCFALGATRIMAAIAISRSALH